MTIHLSTRRWQDQVILLLGLWLFISPWALDFPSGAPLGMNAHIAGALMAILAAFDLYKTYLWAVVLNLLVGTWVAISPWVLGMTDTRRMVNSLLVVGIATVVLGLWELRSDPELHRQWAGSGTAG